VRFVDFHVFLMSVVVFESKTFPIVHFHFSFSSFGTHGPGWMEKWEMGNGHGKSFAADFFVFVEAQSSP